MIAVVPLAPRPGEPLAARPELALGALGAVGALRGTLFREAWLGAAEPRLLDMARAAGLTPLPLPPGPPTDPPPLPPGSAACARALRAGGALGREALALVDPAALGLGPELLRAAADRHRAGGHPALMTAAPPRDHPCQFRRPMHIAATGVLDPAGRAAPAAPQALAPRLAGRPGSWRVAFPAGGAVPAGWELEILDPAGGERELCPRLPGSGAASFACTLADRAPGPLAWTLLRDAGSGPHDTVLPFAPPGAPWRVDPRSGAVCDAGGAAIHGRQAFPPVLVPDGTLCILAPGLEPDHPEALARAAVLPFVAPPPAPRPVRDSLGLLAHGLRGAEAP
jgi:hypothetical protein